MKEEKKILLLLICFLLQTVHVFAQQLPVSTHYVLNNYAYNPAIAGTKPYAVATVNYRNQWVGFKDAPKSYLISVHNSVGKEKKVGVGALINSDNTGLLGRTNGYLTFAYQIKLNKTYKLGLGLSAGMTQYRIKLYDAKVADSGDELLTGNILSNNVFDSNAGLYFYSDKLFFGLSGYQYLGNKITWKDSQSNLSPHYYATLGYTFKVSKTIDVQPTVLVKYNKPTPIQPEFTLRGIYKSMYWIGASYRLKDAASLLLGVTIKEKLSIAYAYDFPISKLRNHTSGSHEIVLTYQLKKLKKKLNSDEVEFNDIDNSIKSKLKKQNEEGTK